MKHQEQPNFIQTHQFVIKFAKHLILEMILEFTMLEIHGKFPILKLYPHNEGT